MTPATDGACAGDDVGSRRVAEPVGDDGADAGRVPSPREPPTVDVGPRAEEEVHAPEPPVEMALGLARHRERRATERAVGPSIEAPTVKEIPQEVPHPWDAPTHVS
jgi:hypothetical protein